MFLVKSRKVSFQLGIYQHRQLLMHLYPWLCGSKNEQHLLGQAADIHAMGSTKEDNKALFETAVSLIRQGKISVGQCIDEYNYSWVHISIPGKHVNNIIHIK